MVFRILGSILLLWGIADLVIGLQGGDLWAQVGITLPDIVWSYSHYIAIIGGAFIFSLGGSDTKDVPQE